MEIAHVSRPGTVAVDPVSAALSYWVSSMSSSIQGAEYMVDTPMCPDSFWPPFQGSKTPKLRGPGEATESYAARRDVAVKTLASVVRYGLQLGLAPEAAVQGIFVVGGRLSMYAEQMVALCLTAGHEHQVIEHGPERCTVQMRRRGATAWTSYTYTIEDAIQAGHVPDHGPNEGPHGTWPDGRPKKSPGNPKYLTDPAAMLYARASSIACRATCPDVLRGLTAYEDLTTDTAEVSAEVVETRAPRLEIAAGPQVEQPEASTPEIVCPPLPAGAGQLSHVKSLFESVGMGGRSAAARAARLEYVSDIVGREILDPRGLTVDEARLVEDALEGRVEDADVAESTALEADRDDS